MKDLTDAFETESFFDDDRRLQDWKVHKMMQAALSLQACGNVKQAEVEFRKLLASPCNMHAKNEVRVNMAGMFMMTPGREKEGLAGTSLHMISFKKKNVMGSNIKA